MSVKDWPATSVAFWEEGEPAISAGAPRGWRMRMRITRGYGAHFLKPSQDLRNRGRAAADGRMGEEQSRARGHGVSIANRDHGSAAAELDGPRAMMAGNSPGTPKVSVVLTTYKRAHLLPATIDSILAQTFRDFELVISDDCSPDETEKGGREYERSDARVRYRRGAKNVGMPGNLNAGILATSGEYIANLHDGDEYDPTLIERWSCSAGRLSSGRLCVQWVSRIGQQREYGAGMAGAAAPMHARLSAAGNDVSSDPGISILRCGER